MLRHKSGQATDVLAARSGNVRRARCHHGGKRLPFGIGYMHAALTARADQRIALIERAHEAAKLADIHARKLCRCNIEKTAPAGGRAGDKRQMLRAEQHRREIADHLGHAGKRRAGAKKLLLPRCGNVRFKHRFSRARRAPKRQLGAGALLAEAHGLSVGRRAEALPSGEEVYPLEDVRLALRVIPPQHVRSGGKSHLSLRDIAEILICDLFYLHIGRIRQPARSRVRMSSSSSSSSANASSIISSVIPAARTFSSISFMSSGDSSITRRALSLPCASLSPL